MTQNVSFFDFDYLKPLMSYVLNKPKCIQVLEVVLKNAGERRIVFSCFNPDICTLVRNKQNKYPVMFLTVVSEKNT